MGHKKIILVFPTIALMIILWAFCAVTAFGEGSDVENAIPGGAAADALMAAFDDKNTTNDLGKSPGRADTAAVAVDDTAEAGNSTTVMSLLDIIKKGGIVGYLIILLSIVSLGLILDYAITIRKVKILPPKDVETLSKIIEEGNLETAVDTLDKDRPSFFAQVTIAGLKESRLGYQSMIKAMEDTGEALASAIARKIEHLNVIGNISPMMGLLGTVIGMLRCFNEIANVAGAIEPKQLAGGIFEALVTTCMGLIVAIPSLYGYAVFKNRIDEYTGEAALAAEQIVASFKTNPSDKE